MPKMKTRKAIAKRLKQTSTGKFVRKSPNKRHLNTGKSAKRKRHLRKDKVLGSADVMRAKINLPYGLR